VSERAIKAKGQMPPTGADAECRQCRTCSLLAVAFCTDKAIKAIKDRRLSMVDRATWFGGACDCRGGLGPTDNLDDWHICRLWRRV